MNKAILMGRLTRDPEVRYSQSETPVAVARYTLAVNRKIKKDGEPDADFINCVVFGKSGEFAEKYFKKGQMICISGRIQVRSYDDQTGQKHWITEVVVEEQAFAESKNSFETRLKSESNNNNSNASGSGSSSSSSGTDSGLNSSFNNLNPEESQMLDDLDDEDLPF